MTAASPPPIERSLADAIVAMFKPSEYVPPWWARSCHLNTILGSILVAPPLPDYKRQRWNTDDGDFIDIDFLARKGPKARGIAVLCHGLESTTTGPLTSRQAHALAEKGFEVAAVSFRGCSGEDNLTPGGYHLGFTKDLRMVAERLHKEDPQRRIYLTASSLGGNVIGKLLGELGEKARDLNICGAAVGCVPMNAVESQGTFDSTWFKRLVYSGNFLRSLVPKAERMHARFPGLFDIEAVRQAKTLADFDSAYITPIYGFRDKHDYYAQSGCQPLLKHVAVPLLVVNALDDPFFHPDSLLMQEQVAPAPVRLVYHRHGGHCGFLEGLHNFSLDLGAMLAKTVTGRRLPSQGTSPNGWLPEEMARFLAHVDDSLDAAANKSQPAASHPAAPGA